jgi:DNA-binding MarR family transcriptional regulator
MKRDVVDDILDQWGEERPELDTSSLGVIVRVMSLNRAFLRQAAKALEPLGLELFEYDVLSALRRQGRPYALLASRLAKLEARGMVQRRAGKRDRRAVIVSLTTSGKRAIDDAIHARLDAADNSLQGISSKERKDLAVLLRKVRLSGAGVDEGEKPG